MRVCVVGGGGREHALAMAMGRTADVVVAPGNAGMAALGVECLAARPEEIEADLYVIGPEQPLVDGMADRLRAAGRLVFGPGADGATLEGSKAWMKEILTAAAVPTAAYATFDQAGPAIEYLRGMPGPWVVKTDGLAAGKGVLVTDDLDAAERDVLAKLSGQSFGAAGTCVVIEEALVGPELSVMAVCDGRRAVPLAPAQDFKRVGDGDTGPNTGGMGAYSPVPGAGSELVEVVMDRAVRPTLAALEERHVDFRGVLYAGIVLTAHGPKVLEFNVRFGDPETQVVLPLWEGDVAATLAAAAGGHLETVDVPEFGSRAATCVVLGAPGYPENPRTGDPIEGFLEAARDERITIFSAGIGRNDAGALVTAGGRVLAVGATGDTIGAARETVYGAIPAISWPDIQYRTDIAAEAAARAG